MSENTDTGRIGEFLASYLLETHGVEVHHVDRAGADLWCRVKDRLFTVQVKAASKPLSRRKTSSTSYYTYMTKNKNADYFCFVALDLRLLLLRNVALVRATTMRIASTEFTEEAQTASVEEMLAAT